MASILLFTNKTMVSRSGRDLRDTETTGLYSPSNRFHIIVTLERHKANEK
jgi:hypothetical protein